MLATMLGEVGFRSGVSRPAVTSLVALALSSIGCTRVVRMDPAELPRVAAALADEGSDPIEVRTVDHRTIHIDRDVKFVRVYPLEDPDADPSVFRLPLRARVEGSTLELEDRKHPGGATYSVGAVVTEVVVRDYGRANPLLYGMLVGAVVGATVGALASPSECNNGDDDGGARFCPTRTGGAVLLGLAGLSVGAVVSIPFVLDRKYY